MQQKQRMYFLVMYNISPIQAGIQAGHAQQEYCNKYFNDSDFQQWALHDKTWMVMNGGTSNRTGKNAYNEDVTIGSMEMYLEELTLNNIKCAAFYEPDLNNATSAIAFLVPEKCYNKETYPDLESSKIIIAFGGKKPEPEILESFMNDYLKGAYDMTSEEIYLRNFIKNLRFA